MDLSVTVSVPFEHTTNEFQFSWETFLGHRWLSLDEPRLIGQNAYWLGGGVTQHSDTIWCVWVSCTWCSPRSHDLVSMVN
jgi:hypothetical protein